MDDILHQLATISLQLPPFTVDALPSISDGRTAESVHTQPQFHIGKPPPAWEGDEEYAFRARKTQIAKGGAQIAKGGAQIAKGGGAAGDDRLNRGIIDVSPLALYHLRQLHN